MTNGLWQLVFLLLILLKFIIVSKLNIFPIFQLFVFFQYSTHYLFQFFFLVYLNFPMQKYCLNQLLGFCYHCLSHFYWFLLLTIYTFHFWIVVTNFCFLVSMKTCLHFWHISPTSYLSHFNTNNLILLIPFSLLLIFCLPM